MLDNKCASGDKVTPWKGEVLGAQGDRASCEEGSLLEPGRSKSETRRDGTVGLRLGANLAFLGTSKEFRVHPLQAADGPSILEAAWKELQRCPDFGNLRLLCRQGHVWRDVSNASGVSGDLALDFHPGLGSQRNQIQWLREEAVFQVRALERLSAWPAVLACRDEEGIYALDREDHLSSLVWRAALRSCTSHSSMSGNLCEPPSLKLVRVDMIRSPDSWRRYLFERSEVVRDVRDARMNGTFKGASLGDFVLRPINHVGMESEDEVFLWHGCCVTSASKISLDGLNPNMAGRASGTLFGTGSYAAENFSKADLYSGINPHGALRGDETLAVVMLRTTPGISERLHTPVRDKTAPAPGFHSAWAASPSDGVPKGCVQHREYIFYRKASSLLVPTAVVYYKHVSDCKCTRCR